MRQKVLSLCKQVCNSILKQKCPALFARLSFVRDWELRISLRSFRDSFGEALQTKQPCCALRSSGFYLAVTRRGITKLTLFTLWFLKGVLYNGKPCKTEFYRAFYFILSLRKQVCSSILKQKCPALCARLSYVARRGIEPRTSGLWILRSNHLSYLAKTSDIALKCSFSAIAGANIILNYKSPIPIFYLLYFFYIAVITIDQ